MELYIEPLRPLKRKTRFYKGDIPWNKGRKGWSTNNEKKKKIILANLAEGRKHNWEKRDRSQVHNSIPCAVYDLEGNFLSAHVSEGRAADAYGQIRRNVVECVQGKRGRCGSYQFRAAKVEVFRGEKLVKKSPIEPYKRRSRWSKIKEKENNNQ